MFREFSLCLLFFGALASAAFAQATTGDPPNGAGSWSHEEIEIVGQQPASYEPREVGVARVETPLAEIPQSIQVLTPTLLREQGVSTLAEALVNVSGVVPAQPSEAVLTNPLVRGFEAEIFLDGLIGYADTAVIDPSSLAATERIEVAKGPTSVLFGGGAGAPVGGLINLVSKTPLPEAAYAFGFRAGSFATYAPSVDLNQPLGERAAVRFAGEYVSSEDFVDEVEIERITLSPSFSLALGDDTDFVLRTGYNRIEQLEYAGLPAEIANAPGVHADRFSGATDAPDTEIENWHVSGALTHRFSDALAATLTVRRYANEFDELASFIFPAFFPPTGTAYPIIKGRLPSDVDEWTADASVTWELETGPLAHTVLGGVQYDSTKYEGALGFDFFPIGIIDFADPSSDAPFGAKPALTSFFVTDYETVGIYVQDQVTVAERFHVLAGLRYSRLSIDERVGGAGNDESYGEVDPRVGLTVDVLEGFSLFAGYATGSRLSLFFTGAASPRPERSESVEGGVKLALSSIGLSGTLAGYRIERTNVPTPDLLNPGLSVQTGEQRSRGVEADVIFEPTPAWSLLASYAFTDAEVARDALIPRGDTLARVPRHAGRLALRYRIASGALSGLGLGLGMSGATHAELTLPNSLRSDGYVTFDAQASYEIGPFRLGLNVVNLFDEDYFTPYAYLAQAVVRPGAPRSAFATVEVAF
jgi:iron complex outermembrane receptor protein